MKIFNLRISFGNILSQLKLKQKSKGVTLLELGVVLLVIGIVISGAYVAYDFFIKRARTTKTMIEMKDYRKGFESFHSVYGALPGDMTSASRRIDSTMIDGNGDGKIASETEQNAFWPHMSYSKMISKPSGGKYENVATNVSPKVGVNLPRLQDSDDIAIGVVYNTPSGVRANSFILGGLNGRAVTTPRFSVEEVQIMDQKFDDNNPTTGGVMCGMGVQSGTITACSYANASVQSDANIFIPFTPQTTDASNSCPAQSVQISQQLVANAPVIAANATVTYNCRDINPSYSGQYSLTCNPVKDSANNVIGYSISTASTSCSLKTCAVPTLSSISGAASIQSTAVQSGQYLSYTCNAGLYATKSLCSPNLSTDAASLNPAPACTSSPTGVANNIPIYAPDAQTFKDSGRKFNDDGSTLYDIFSGNKIFRLFGSTSTSTNYISKYGAQNTGVVPSLIYDNGTSVGIGTSTPNSSTILELNSTNKAFLPPRMTTAQMSAITAPSAGMIVYTTDNGALQMWDASTAKWIIITSSTSPTATTVPAGTIVAWGSGTIPPGWLLLDGTTYSAATYPDLAAALGCATTNTACPLPDTRGYFLRGYGTNGTTITNSLGETVAPTSGTGALLSRQGDAIRNITGKVNIGFENAPNPSGAFYENTFTGDGVAGSGLRFSNINFDASRVVPTATENRPYNIAVNYIIKAKNVQLSSQDLTTMLASMMSTGTPPNANSIAMFDDTGTGGTTGTKLKSSLLTQTPQIAPLIGDILKYNATGGVGASVMDLSATGMLLKPTSGMALQIGDVGTGIANSNTSGLSGLTNTLDFYVNGGRQMFLNASGTLTVASLSATSLSPTTLTVGAGGLSTTTLSASGTSTLTGLLTANGGISTAGLTASALTLNGNGTITGNLSVTGTSTLTGLLTANGGVRVGSTTVIDSSGNITLPTGSNITSSGNTVRIAKAVQFTLTPPATSLSGISSALYIGDNGSSLYFNDSSGNPNKLLTASASVVECTIPNAGDIGSGTGSLAGSCNTSGSTITPTITKFSDGAGSSIYGSSFKFSATEFSSYDFTKYHITVVLDYPTGSNDAPQDIVVCSGKVSSVRSVFYAHCIEVIKSSNPYQLRVVLTPYK